MVEKVIKRNGCLVDFDSYKITTAILAALNVTKEGNYEVAQKLCDKVVDKIQIYDKIKVEQIQDIVEEILMVNGYYQTAKKYILYREEHAQQRNFESQLLKRIEKLDKETTRDNANIGHGTASKMYSIASEASKFYYINKLIPKHLAKLHTEGLAHFHDLDYFSKCPNCLSLPLEQILRTGYNGEYGFVNPPKRIKTALDLAANIIQRASCDIFGGTMLPDLDIAVENLINDKVIAEPTDEDIAQACQSLLFNLATLPSRAGNQVPFSSITFGLGTGIWARKLSFALLKEYEKGMGRNETFIFPNVVFKWKKGINIYKTDPNYDLFRESIRVLCRRMNPTYSFMDNAGNENYNPLEVNVMGCRSRIIANCNGEAISRGRGNIFPTTINLPRIALKTKGTHYNKDIKDFYKKLDDILDKTIELSMFRYNILKNLTPKDMPFVFGEGVYYKSENLSPNDIIEESLKHGTIGVGFVGLAECCKELIGQHQGESSKGLQLALDINKYLRDYCDTKTKELNLNITCYATPAESTINKVIKDREDFGIIADVTDRDYYTNSFHVPVYFPISIARKITIEGQFHRFNNAGHITYVELSDAPKENIDGVEQILLYMLDSDIGYAGINFPFDECLNPDCKNYGIIPDICPKCGSTNIRHLARISGYLGIEDRINDSKKAEIKDRLKHDQF